VNNDNEKTGKQVETDATEDIDVADADAELVRGGVKPPSPPAGPIPVPYPNSG
jgi:hypothetical protein